MFELKIDRRSKISLERQVENQLKRAIRQQVFSDDIPLPTPLELSQQLVLDFNTVKSVYETLRKQGFITLKDGIYAAMVITVHHVYFQKVFRLTDIFEMNHLKASQKTLSNEVVACPNQLLKENFYPDDQFLKYERLMYGNDQPFIRVETYLPLKTYPFIQNLDIENTLYWEAIEKQTGHTINKVEQHIRFIPVTQRDQDLFDDSSIELMSIIDIYFYNQSGELLDHTLLSAPSHYLNIQLDFKLND